MENFFFGGGGGGGGGKGGVGGGRGGGGGGGQGKQGVLWDMCQWCGECIIRYSYKNA